MDRRQFLRLTGGSAAAAALTAWLAPGWSRRVGPVPKAQVDPEEAPEARAPLLAILVPKDEGQGFERGQAIGALFHHGGERVLADLAAVELVCARADQVPAEARAEAAGEPWFVLVTRDGGGVRVHAFTPDLPPEPPARPPEGSTLADTEGAAATRVWVFADALHEFLRPHVHVAETDVFARATVARKRYVDQPPPGAHWANLLSCGVSVEGVSTAQPTVGCGMGMVPSLSKRFLHFYVRG